MGACRPDIREQLKVGDHIFVVSGKVPGVDQFVMGGFEVAEKITARDAFRLFPEHRLRKLEDGQMTGNIIVNGAGRQHVLDDHTSFARRIQNYVVGTNLIALSTATEIAEGRKHTLDALRDILHKHGNSPFEILGRCGRGLTDKQIVELRDWLAAVKTAAHDLESRSMRRAATGNARFQAIDSKSRKAV